jgi:hypothetical protein
MRDYGKVSPQFWIGATGRALRGDPEAQLVALYLMTSPHANMIGVFHCPLVYIVHETGLTSEGASKGLRRLIEADFCTYEAESEYVFVHQFAANQIGDTLDPKDNRAKAVDRELEKVPKGQCWRAFRARYAVPFNLPTLAAVTAPTEAPSEPLRSQKQKQEQEQKEQPPIPPKGGGTPTLGLKAWLDSLKASGEKPIPPDDAVFAYADEVGIPHDFLRLAWLEFRHQHTQPNAKRYKDWRAHFRNSVRKNWGRLWWIDPASNTYQLTTVGQQAQRAHTEKTEKTKEAA